MKTKQFSRMDPFRRIRSPKFAIGQLGVFAIPSENIIMNPDFFEGGDGEDVKQTQKGEEEEVSSDSTTIIFVIAAIMLVLMLFEKN